MVLAWLVTDASHWEISGAEFRVADKICCYSVHGKVRRGHCLLAKLGVIKAQ